MITVLAQRRSLASSVITAPPPRAPATAAAAAAPLAGRGAMVSARAALAALVALLAQLASTQEEAAAALGAPPLQQANATEPACGARCEKWVAIVEVLVVLGVGLLAVSAGFWLIHSIDAPTRFVGGAAAAERRPHQD